MTVLYILLALVVLLLLITVHEFGHYCAGKILGFKINEFSIGFGPALFKKTKKNGEIFAVRLLPLGGYCAFEGEDEAGNEQPGSFNKMPAWKRLVVLLSGVFFNFLFGILTAAIYLMVAGYTMPVITASKAQAYGSDIGLRQHDIVIAVDGKRIEAYRSFTSMIDKFGSGDSFTVTVNRDGEIIDVVATKGKYDNYYYVAKQFEFENKIFTSDVGDDGKRQAKDIDEFLNEVILIGHEDRGVVKSEEEVKNALIEYFGKLYKSDDTEKSETYTAEDVENFLKADSGALVYVKSSVGIGVTMANAAEGKYGFFEAMAKAWPFCFYLCGMIFGAFGGLFTGAVPVSETGGTITAISQIAQISQQGILYFLLLLPLLAMNLAVFNILPIPALDGAKAVFVIIEMIFRKPVNRKVEGWIHTIGLFLLLALVVILDINHFFFASTFLRL